MAERPSLVLGIDTSTAVVVGLAHGPVVLATARVDDPRAHAEQLVPLIRRVCAGAGQAPAAVDRIVVGLGPGPFTGLRVGVVTARVLAVTLGAALHGICSLDVIAAQHAAGRPDADFLVATDARRREVYWARYAPDGRRLAGPEVSRPTALPDAPVVGPAADLYADLFAAVPGPRVIESAALVTAGPDLPAAGERPLYLRRPDAAEPTRRKSVLVTGRRGR